MIRACNACGESYEAVLSSSRFCSARCRQWSHRNPGAAVRAQSWTGDRPATGPNGPVAAPSSLVRAAVLADLAAVGRDGSFLGAVALGLAEQIDASTNGQGAAPLIRELRQTMAAALTGPFGPVAALSVPSGTVADPLDELRARRDHVKTPAKRKGFRP